MNNNSLIDLHAHLGSSVSPSVLWDLAHEMGIRLQYKNFFEFQANMMVDDKINHKAYLYKFKESHLIQSSPTAIMRSVYAAISNAYREQMLTHMEIRFNPMKRNGLNKEYDLDMVIMNAIIGMKKACLTYPIKVGLILETDREFTGEQSEIIAQKAVKFKSEGIIGFDISGFSPKDFNINDHAKAFKIAKSGGLGITCHTGEVTDSKEVLEFVEVCKPIRIGHGLQIWTDKDAMQHISKLGITLEICPTSNIKTGIVKNYRSFKEIFDSLRTNGVNFTINSDGNVFLQSKVRDEFMKLISYGAMDNETMEWCIDNSLKATFIK